VLSNQRDKAICSCCCGENLNLRIVNVEDKTKPIKIDQFRCDIEMVSAFAWHDSDDVIAMVGHSSFIQLYFVQE